MKQNWKTVIASVDNFRDAINQFIDEYEMLETFHEENTEVDDSVWVHVDVAKEEREELESKIQQLEKALEERNEEYNLLATKYNLLTTKYLQVQEQLYTKKVSEIKSKRKIVKRKSRLNNNIEDDDIPF